MDAYQRQLLGLLKGKQDNTYDMQMRAALNPQRSDADLGMQALSGIVKTIADKRNERRAAQMLSMTAEQTKAVKDREKAFEDAMTMYKAGLNVPPELAERAGLPQIAGQASKPKGSGKIYSTPYMIQKEDGQWYERRIIHDIDGTAKRIEDTPLSGQPMQAKLKQQTMNSQMNDWSDSENNAYRNIMERLKNITVYDDEGKRVQDMSGQGAYLKKLKILPKAGITQRVLDSIASTFEPIQGGYKSQFGEGINTDQVP
ncbi:MAG: hypothetical protein RDU76_06240 [Candidatus Edwardsbacteria bacterium]|nr:hypothetical protein [Candidatus Edwardsbacteria bacterium]